MCLLPNEGWINFLPARLVSKESEMVTAKFEPRQNV
jgi:hypothetical protein